MTENSDPGENALAERVNGILKEEWLNAMRFKNMNQVQVELNKIIRIYNQFRPHSSLAMKTPGFVHANPCEVKRMWKNYYKKKESGSFAEPNKVMVTL